MATETKDCPNCGKQMIKEWTNRVLTSYPPQYPMMWWCACGHTEDAGVLRGKTGEAMRRERWETAQPGYGGVSWSIPEDHALVARMTALEERVARLEPKPPTPPDPFANTVGVRTEPDGTKVFTFPGHLYLFGRDELRALMATFDLRVEFTDE